MSNRNALTERLIQILFKLVRRPHSRQELAREFEVDVKTISRVIDALSLEFPIVEKRKGREVYYGFPEDTSFSILTISPEETATMLHAQQSIAGIGITANGSPFAEYADSLLIKIRQALPKSIVRRMDALSNVYGSSIVPDHQNFILHLTVSIKMVGCLQTI